LRETDTHGPMPFRRHAKARSNMRANKIPAAAMARAGEDVESGFKPIVEAVGDFDRLVPGMIRWQSAVIGLLRPIGREVIVWLDHRHATRNCFRRINLDFVIVLSMSK